MSGAVVSERVVRALRDLGLTDYEVSAYLVLVGRGESSAGDLSKETQIPYSKVYSVLESLEEKGWVELGGGRPRLYYPRSPTEALKVESLRRENRMVELERVIVSELQPAYEKREIREKPEIWIIRGEENVSAKVRDMLARAERELMIALPLVPGTLVSTFMPSLTSLMDRRVRIQLLTTPDALRSLPKNLPNLGETRSRDEMFGGGILVDGREAVLFLGKGNTGATLLAIWADHIGLTQVAKVYFRHLWETAKPV